MLMGFMNKQGARHHDEFIGLFQTNVDGTTFTFAGTSFGTAHANRVITVAFFVQGGSATDLVSVSIDGSTTGVVTHSEQIAAGATVKLIVASKAVAAGASGDIAITMDVSAARCAILVYAHRRGTSPTVVFDTTQVAGLLGDNDPLTVVAGGLLMAFSTITGSTGAVATYNGVVLAEDCDQVHQEIGTMRIFGARGYTPGTTQNCTVQHTDDGGGMNSGRYIGLAFGVES